MPRRLLFLAALVALAPVTARAADKRPMTVDDLFKFKRVGDPQISPNGTQVVYTVAEVDLAANKTATHLWVAPTQEGGKPRQLTSAGKSDRHPRWSPDGRRLLFESNRSGSVQLWVLDLDGGEARRLTDVSTEAANGVWSPDGSQIAFVSAVYPEFSEKPFKES